MMRPQEFLHAVRERAAAHLPADLRGWRAQVQYAMLQAHYGNPRVHYEVWLVRKTGRVEVGLHIEAAREESHALAGLLAEHADELRAALGPAVELEEWTASWTRLHETLPLGPLDDALCDEIAGRLAALVTCTQPLLTAASANTARPRALHNANGGRRWQRRSRAGRP